ncbi:tRNA (adenosine(37)-N6)-dimethylallyltransferase MiaA [candidate division FCPU426 bacterium]|nr:tRNA (adenosine(37)-N6)-dimethylallyltransferase MiaA [candidate division FCPU426 bacterium]
MNASSAYCNLIAIIGPTASGKTLLASSIAARLGGEIISADSRQVYRGLNIGSGKDLEAYRLQGRNIPCHLIDIADVNQEFSVFHFQQAFYRVFQDCRARNVWPLLVGGTGLYLESVLLEYKLAPVPESPLLRAKLQTWTREELIHRLQCSGKKMHNITDLTSRERLLRAIEIAEHEKHAPGADTMPLNPLIIGLRWDRGLLQKRIGDRLEERLQKGLIEEVAQLQAGGVSWERLRALGLEYRCVADYLQGRIHSRNDLFQKLKSAICHYAKRQDTWFRRMERRGLGIHWIRGADGQEAWHIIAAALEKGLQ